MRYWHLDHPSRAGQLNIGSVTALVAAIGEADAASFATEVLNTSGGSKDLAVHHLCLGVR
jgi:enolase